MALWNEEDYEIAADSGKLYEFMKEHIPKEHWSEEMLSDCRSRENIKALKALLNHGVDPDMCDESAMYNNDFSTYAIRFLFADLENLAVLISSGKSSFQVDDDHSDCKNAVSMAVWYELDSIELLIENGFAVNDVDFDALDVPMQKLCVAVKTCKRIIIILLALKRRRINCMSHLDRFLLRDLAVAIYSTRTESKWARNTVFFKELKDYASSGYLTEYLIEQVDPKHYNIARNNKGRTILSYAVQSPEYYDIVWILVVKYHVNLVGALPRAFQYGSADIVELLCENGADISELNVWFFEQHQHVYNSREKLKILAKYHKRKRACRNACIIMLGLIRRTRVTVLNCIAWSIWATRAHESW